MAGWAIVAIPAADDPVYKISSEKVPHLTLMYLGDQEGNPSEVKMASFLKHVAETSLDRFHLQVDRRGTLGPDNADVVFFRKTQQVQDLKSIRANLLTNRAISDAYNSVDQYPEWTPHVTLGYPTSPAKEDDRDYPGIYGVYFDRLALWTGDFEGYEFELSPQPDEFSPEVAMSATLAGFLEEQGVELKHHGVKGMKWGVRKKRKNAVQKSTDRKEAERALSKPIEAMTNKQLKTANNRLQLERSYKELTKNPTFIEKVAKGNNSVRTLLGVGGTAVAAAALYNNKDLRNIVKGGATLINDFMRSQGAREAGYYTASTIQKSIRR